MIATQDSGGTGESSATATSQVTSTTTPQGNGREKNTGPVPLLARPAGRSAGGDGTPLHVGLAEPDPERKPVRQARPLLVGLSVGSFAQLLQVTAFDAIKTGDFGPENRGSVEFAKLEHSGPHSASVLLVCRETPQGGSETFTTYLAKLSAVAPGRFAMSALEPQS